MANLTCTNLLRVCHLRVVRLAPDGSPEPGADSLYEHSAPILFGYTPQQPERTRFEQLNGCGDECGLFIDSPKAVNSVDMRLDLCHLDAELIELLAGGSVIADGSDTIGYLAPTDTTVSEWGVGIETWSLQWSGRQRALVNGQPGYYRHFFPRTNWQVGEVTKDNSGFSTIPLTGVGEVNSGYATGLDTDPLPVTVGDAAYGWFVTDERPAGECGYQSIAS